MIHDIIREHDPSTCRSISSPIDLRIFRDERVGWPRQRGVSPCFLEALAADDVDDVADECMTTDEGQCYVKSLGLRHRLRSGSSCLFNIDTRRAIDTDERSCSVSSRFNMFLLRLDSMFPWCIEWRLNLVARSNGSRQNRIISRVKSIVDTALYIWKQNLTLLRLFFILF